MTRHFAALVLASTLLAGCATMIDTPFQKVTLKTPGTDHGHCLIDNGIVRYQIHSNQTIKMQRNDADLKITCTAPGNRRVETVIDRDLNAWSIANITNAIIPGVTYDHFSGALYDYPNVISVDFGPGPGPGFPLPEYQRPGAIPPSSQGIEGYSPALNKKPGEERVVNEPPRKMDMNELRARSHPLGANTSRPGGGSAVEIYNP